MKNQSQFNRRRVLSLLAAGAGLASVPGWAWADDEVATIGNIALATTGLSGKSVIVVGGGMAGAGRAGGKDVDVVGTEGSGR